MYRIVGLLQALVSDVDNEIAGLVERNGKRLAVDFPGVVKGCATYALASRRLYHLQEEMGLAAGRYGVYVVYYEDRAVGVVTYSMYTTWYWVPGKGFAAIRGPLIAGWLDQYRPARAKRRGIEVLQLVAKEAAAEDVVTGHAWSVVRPTNSAAVRILEAVDNGFGGFGAVGHPRSYRSIDGVQAPRQLYVANFAMNALRPSAR